MQTYFIRSILFMSFCQNWWQNINTNKYCLNAKPKQKMVHIGYLCLTWINKWSIFRAMASTPLEKSIIINFVPTRYELMMEQTTNTKLNSLNYYVRILFLCSLQHFVFHFNEWNGNIYLTHKNRMWNLYILVIVVFVCSVETQSYTLNNLNRNLYTHRNVTII